VVVGSVWAAEVKGTIVLDGPAPEPEVMTIEPKTGPHSTEGCGSLRKISQKLLVDREGGVQNAVVWVGSPSSSPAQLSDLPVVLNQRRCVFDPHVVALVPGQRLAIRNSDPTLHNIRIFREGKPAMLMHQWQKPDAADITWSFTEPGRYTVRCGVHPWMYAWAMVIPERAFAVTDKKGGFLIPDVPPGPHTLRVWHETLGEKELPIQVEPDGEELRPVRFSQRKD
jgi:plastocyanin